MAKDKRTKEQKVADKKYSDTMSQYWNKRKKDTDYSDLYEDFHNRTSGGTTLSSDKALNAWENMMLSDQGYKDWSLKKEALDWSGGDEEKASRYLNARPFGYLDEEKWPTAKLQEMLYNAREGRPGEAGKDSRQWPNWTQAIQDALYLRGASDKYTPSTEPSNSAENKGQGFQLKEEPPKDRSNLSFDSIVEEVIPGADPNNLSEEQKDLVADAIEKEKGYTPGDRTKAILGDERIAKIEAAKNNENDLPSENQDNGLLDKLKATSEDLNQRKANPDGEYTGIPGENAQGNTLGYRSLINDVRDVAYTNDDLKAARLNDSVRQEAIAAKKEAKSVINDIKKYDREYTDLLGDLEKTNKKSEKMLIKGLINERKAKLDELQGKVDSINAEFESKYGMTINEAMSGSDKNTEALEAAGIDPEALSALAGEKYNEITDLLGQRAEVNNELDYISDDIKDDVNLLLQPNATQEQLDAVYAKLEKIEPKLREVINNKVNLNKNTLDTLGEVVSNINDPDVTEAYQNLQGMAQGFLDQKIDISNPETLKALQVYEKEFSDIIKNQEMYDKDTRYANDMRLSAVNRLMFNIFDDIKSAIVFAAAIESGNPQAVRSALDMYNYKIQEAENKRKTDQYGAYTENRIREITQDNIARFKKITEIDPDIAKLERVLNIQEGEAGKRQMDALEAGFEAFNKYKQDNPGSAVDFAAWVSANRNAGGVLGQIISTLLMNFPDLKNAAGTLLQGTNDTSSDGTKKEDIIDVSGGKKKTSSILDGVVGKLGEKRQAEQPKEKDPALMMDMQNTVGQALASRVAPPQASAPQAGAPKTSNGFGRTNLA